MITKKTTFKELMEKHPEAAEILFNHGMHCIGCRIGETETIEQGAIAHGIDPDKLIKELNKIIKK